MERLVPLTDLPIYHASGFSHPELLIYTDESPEFPIVATWGLVPHWVENDEAGKKLWNNTLNARSETFFEKPSFREAARHSRCIIYVDGFYEHHHFEKKTYPYFIYRKDSEPLALTGLWTEWRKDNGGREYTFSIVTTEGNPMMARIHNNPKLKGPRMPLILNEEDEDKWLVQIAGGLEFGEVKSIIRPFPEAELSSHTVSKLRGKEYKGNVEEISNEVIYPELNNLF
ncbi:SOS response-associated peptidase [Tamlana fucoidanivorans]|uniref:SOS response-associated peptidase n=1 Tax=Allotamlana fucoidanivorans TaxID=2583814 RepID=UPI001E3A9FB8|nr:SOS response-associated peptidase [Tamlana fucoidanivorans]